MRHKIFIPVIFLIVTGVFGQSTDTYLLAGKEKIEQGIQNWNGQEMLEARAHFERGLTLNDKPWLFHYYIAYCDQQLGHFVQGKKDKKKAIEYVNNAIEHLNKSIKLNSDFAEGYGLLSSMYGEKIGLQSWTGIVYGSRSSTLMRKALMLEPNNPRLYMIKGISAMFTPEKWGGSKTEAKKLFFKAAELFKNDHPESIMPDWGDSDVYAWLGQAELSLGDTLSAVIHYEKALEINPKNSWVKFQLIPKVQK